MKKAEKVLFVDNLARELQDAKSVVLVNYSGLSVKVQQDLKARLKEAGARMIVVKNTLLKRAGEAVKIDPNLIKDEVLTGQTALIIADNDPVAPISVLGKFMKEFDLPKFKVGLVEGSFQDAEGLAKLSTLPGRDALLGQLLGSLMSNLQNFVFTLQNPMQKLVYALNAKASA